jgi:hypothetical protein
MLRRLHTRLLWGFALAGSLTPASYLSAQAPEGPAAVVEGRGNGICLARPIDGRDGSASDANGKLFFILAHPRTLPGLKAKGFSEADCDAAALATDKQRDEYKERVCELAASGNDAVQRQLETVFGEAPAVLCANAEMIVGAWKREQRGGE